jgi:hypothetical protein
MRWRALRSAGIESYTFTGKPEADPRFGFIG